MVRLQRNLLKLDKTGCSKIGTKVNDLDERIKEAILEFEDLLESHVYEQILPQLESSSSRGERDHLSFSVDLQLQSSSGDEKDQLSFDQILPKIESSLGDERDCLSFDQIRPQLESSSGDERDHLFFKSSSGDETDHSSFKREQLPFFVDLQSLQHCVDYLLERVSAMEVEYDVELLNMPEEEGEPISSRIDFGGINSNMVGLFDEFEETRDSLLPEDERNWLLVSGMAGVGKTAFAKKVFEDPLIKRHFELRAWVKVGRKCEFSETLQCILAQVDTNTRYQMLTQRHDEGDEKLVALLEERLNDKNCLIVLDDVWEWDTRLMLRLPKENVRILLTSRLRIKASPVQVVRLLNEEESKKLLGAKLFGEEGFLLTL
ncbi:putative inactive disease susceptibility protein LOV1 [Salvia splendens]|uniref:putative inactive disease susceptibility protein LOV1 n=1 Tax=Salvia splendens TaxID=180675 RepID=UPI001C2621AE|nr:putative inactive disease susceptibility protein LOV1 [Salvia splendens]